MTNYCYWSNGMNVSKMIMEISEAHELSCTNKFKKEESEVEI